MLQVHHASAALHAVVWVRRIFQSVSLSEFARIPLASANWISVAGFLNGLTRKRLSFAISSVSSVQMWRRLINRGRTFRWKWARMETNSTNNSISRLDRSNSAIALTSNRILVRFIWHYFLVLYIVLYISDDVSCNFSACDDVSIINYSNSIF